jgi:hypothetical protein
MKLVALLVQILTLVNKFINLLQAKKKEAEVEKLDQNPGEWFDSHFNGSVSNASGDELSHSADQTKIAESDDSERRIVP